MGIIGMVVALEEEVASFLRKQTVDIKEEKKGAFKVLKFRLGNKDVVCVKSGVGEIFAAAATQYLITAFDPEFIVNFGVCGSLTPELKTEEVALVKSVVHYGFDLSQIDNVEVGKYEQFDSVRIPCDEGLLDKVRKISEKPLPEVICASADKFVGDNDEKRSLCKAYGASICEMESAGVLITCKNAGKPCLIVKAVSDGEGGAEEFSRLVSSASEKYAGLITELCNRS